MKSFLAELRRRHVFRVAAWYAVVAWLVIQIATNTFPHLMFPAWTVRFVIILCLIGFPVAIALAWALEVTPEGLKVTTDVTGVGANSPTPVPVGVSPPWRGASLWLALAGGVLLGAGALHAWRTLSPSSNDDSAKKVLAVLPFENLGGDDGNAAFTAGIHDTLITRIAKIGGMTVISRTSVMVYEGKRPNLKDVAKALSVTHVIEGSVQRDGDQVRIQTQLIDAETDTHLWAETFDRKLEEGFAMQSEIATAIASELAVRLSDHERAALKNIPTRNAEAFEHYVLGRAERVREWDRDDANRAISHFSTAVELDPDFALAFAELSMARTALTVLDVSLLEAELPAARQAYEQALALLPELPEGILARGVYQYLGIRDYAAAESDLTTAVTLLPNNYLAHANLGNLRRRQARWQEAATLLERASIIEPQDPGIPGSLNEVYGALRLREPMERAVQRARVANPGEVWPEIHQAWLKLSYEGDLYGYASTLERLRAQQPDSQNVAIELKWAYLIQGRVHEAIEVMNSIPDEWFGLEGWKAQEIGFAYYLAGDPASAKPYLERALSQLNASSPKPARWDMDSASLLFRALTLAGLGRSDEATAALRKSLSTAPRSRDEVVWASTAAPGMVMLGMIGDMQGALDLARQLVDPPTIYSAYVIWYWALAPLRANSDFRELMSRHGVDVTRNPSALDYDSKAASEK